MHSTCVYYYWAQKASWLTCFRSMLGYSGYVCIFAIWNPSWDTTVGSVFVTEATCNSLWGHVLFLARSPFVPVDVDNIASCVMSFRVKCWMFTILHLIYFFPFIFLFHHVIIFNNCLCCSRVHSLSDFLFLMWFSLQMLHLIIRFLLS